MMGGTVTSESDAGEGSTFFVHLTCDIAPAEKPQRVFDLSGINVLALNPAQHEVPRTIVKRYLAAAGARVTMADDGEHMSRLAQNLAGENRPFVAIIDKHDNLGLAEALRERIRHAGAAVNPRFVMLTRRGRRGFYLESDDTIIVNFDAMRFETFLHAVALAGGRASPEPDESLKGLAYNLQTSATDSSNGGRLILVAEDNETNQKVFVHQIRILGHRCDIVDNGRSALQRWRQGDYALVLTDCHMPEMDGYELTRAIRREEGEHRRTPIVAITADALKGTKEHCLAAGMDDYLSKPIQLHELQQKLKQWLPQGEASDGRQKISPTDMVIAGNQVVDPGALIEVLGVEDKVLFAEFYLDFLRTGEQSVSAVRAAYDGRQNNEVGALAHRLKSSARTIGAHALADCCLALEQAGKSGDWPGIDEHVTELPNHFLDVQKWINNFSDSMSER
jgi:CheY-like chemotaxis protein/HPt (histidine-containing phosphotransfer) domain-containing protein